MGAWSLGVAAVVVVGAALVTVLAGWKIARVGDVLADRLRLGEALFGGIFFGAIISLSGIVMTATAGAGGHAGLAYGNAVGGVAAQTAALGVADAAYRRANLEHAAASLPNVMFAVLVAFLLGVVVLVPLLPDVTLCGVHPGSLAIVIAYVAGLRLAQTSKRLAPWSPRRTSETIDDEPNDEEDAQVSTTRLAATFLLLGALVSAGGWAVARASAVIVEKTGLSETLVGVGLMGLTNALPETITSVAAVRRGALTMAVAGILGGNAFDVLNVAVGDLAYRDGSLYHAVGSQDLIMTVVSLLMTLLILAGMLRRQRDGPAKIGFEGVSMIALWLTALLLIAFW